VLVLIGLVAAAIFVIRPLIDPAAAPATAEIVLDVTHADGSAPNDVELRATSTAIAARIAEAGLVVQKVEPAGDAIVVRFSEADVSDADLDDVIEAIGTSASVEFRLVEAVENPGSGGCPGGPGSPSELTACDNDGSLYRLGPVDIDGSSISSAAATHEVAEGGLPDRWTVQIQFDPEGTRQFADLTGRASETQQQFAIVVDGAVVSAPQVLATITDGNPQIGGNFDETAAESLAGRLMQAALGIELSVRSRTLF
jgi:preprotein translocase subunit SecD